MARASRARLARVKATTAGSDPAPRLDPSAPGAWRAVSAFVRDALERAGIDPARARALRLAPGPDPRATNSTGEGADEFVIEDADGLAGIFAERACELMRRYEDGHEPDFANASLAELFAWCLARAQ